MKKLHFVNFKEGIKSGKIFIIFYFINFHLFSSKI